jgi:hypothetical protein
MSYDSFSVLLHYVLLRDRGSVGDVAAVPYYIFHSPANQVAISSPDQVEIKLFY